MKKDGVWLRPLKFLGMEFDGNLNKLSASTRGGSKLVFDKMDLISSVDYADFLDRINANPDSIDLDGFSMTFDKWKSKYTFRDLVKSKLFGFIQSRLYQGT